MKIYCICVVKNEADIIKQTLSAAAAWADRIFVYDNGSTDDTVEIVRRLAATTPVVQLYKVEDRTYSRALRREPFLDFRHQCEAADWWCILDSDEIYPYSPRTFLHSVPLVYQIVWSISIQYFLTDEDLRRYQKNPSLFADDVPVEKKVRYYTANWSEARFFRYDSKLLWPEGYAFPFAGAVYPKRLPVKHYQHRSPAQLERRIAVRKAVREAGIDAFSHERSTVSWRSAVKPTAQLHFDRGDGQFVIDEALLPRLPLTARLPPRLVNSLRYWKGRMR